VLRSRQPADNVSGLSELLSTAALTIGLPARHARIGIDAAELLDRFDLDT
jgi:hypothetical protein